ncbi:MAG: hypothetical protein Tsb009_05970 [Planctomycetaceae bacterium]
MPEMSDQQRRYREFLDLMPLAITLAGLPASEPGKYYTDEQIEARTYTMKNAMKRARELVRDIIK